MNIPKDDWDEDERRLLNDLGPELEQIRARHRDDPPLELLQAARADALPESLQAPLTSHLEQSAWSRALVEGASAAEPALDEVSERRMSTRIARAARPQTSRWRPRPWLAAAAAAAVLITTIAVLRRGEPSRPSDEQSLPRVESQVASAVPAPAFTLPLDKPDVKLTPAALVLRSEGRGARFVEDIAPALDAYRRSDYADADRRFAALEKVYPTSVEVAFYRAIALLFLNDAPPAIRSLQTARRLDDDAFAAEIAWYLAVAYERAGDPARTRAELESLCRRTSVYASRACEAQSKLKPE